MALLFDNRGAGKLSLKSSDCGEYTLTFPSTAGQFNQFLQTDGNGNLNWATPTIITMADGNAEHPGLSFVADKDTGFYRQSANTINITTNGINRFSINTEQCTLSLPLTFNNENCKISFNETASIAKQDNILTLSNNNDISFTINDNQIINLHHNYIDINQPLLLKSSSTSPGIVITERQRGDGRQLVISGNDFTSPYGTIVNIWHSYYKKGNSPKNSAIALWNTNPNKETNALQFQIVNDNKHGGVIFTKRNGLAEEKNISFQCEWDQKSTPKQLVLTPDGEVKLPSTQQKTTHKQSNVYIDDDGTLYRSTDNQTETLFNLLEEMQTKIIQLEDKIATMEKQ